MVVTRKGVGLISLLAVLFVAVTLITLASGYGNILRLAVRLFGLYGFIMLVTATLMTPFLREVVKIFGNPFIKVHHYFAVLGITFITLHPVFLAIQTLDITVFIPRFNSWYIFWAFAGRPALIICYIALVAGFLRRSAPKYWRIFHALMYIVLFFGIVHANLVGTEFQNLAIIIIYDILFTAAIAVFIVKRYKVYKIKVKKLR
jgi:predicted ferric reductase